MKEYRIVGIFCLTIAALCIAGVAQAQAQPWDTNIVQWAHPTQCVSGRPISSCPVSGYILERAPASSGPFAQLATTPPSVATYSHTGAAAGVNCYRVIATAAPPLLNSLPTNPACKTNVAPPDGPSPPTDLRFVTIAATTDHRHNVTPVVSILGTPPMAGTTFGLVPIGRETQSPPLFTYRKQSYCRVEVGKKELWGTSNPRNLAAPCAPRA